MGLVTTINNMYRKAGLAAATGLVGAGMLLYDAPTVQARNCLPTDVAKEKLAKQKKYLKESGKMQEGAFLERYSTEKGESWSIVVTNTESGMSCLVASGKYWKPVSENKEKVNVEINDDITKKFDSPRTIAGWKFDNSSGSYKRFEFYRLNGNSQIKEQPFDFIRIYNSEGNNKIPQYQKDPSTEVVVIQDTLIERKKDQGYSIDTDKANLIKYQEMFEERIRPKPGGSIERGKIKLGDMFFLSNFAISILGNKTKPDIVTGSPFRTEFFGSNEKECSYSLIVQSNEKGSVVAGRIETGDYMVIDLTKINSNQIDANIISQEEADEKFKNPKCLGI